MKRLCVIPCRKGSKRIKDKNLKLFLGKPIIEYSIEVAEESGFDKILIATDYRGLRDYEEAKIYRRKEENAQDSSGLKDLVIEILEDEKQKGSLYDSVCILYPCAPFVKKEYLIICQNMLETLDYNTVFPVQKNTSRNKDLYIKNEIYVTSEVDHDEEDSRRYKHAGMFFYIKTDWLLKGNSIVSGKCGYIILKEWEAQDINTPEDWTMAEIKYNTNLTKIT